MIPSRRPPRARLLNRREGRKSWIVEAHRMAETARAYPDGADARCINRNVKNNIVRKGLPATPPTPANWSSPSAWRVRQATM
jgi:hypothetical protein